MFHVHNCIFGGIKYHSLSHDFISTNRESFLLPTVCNPEVYEIPSFKGGAVIAMIKTVYWHGESIRSKYSNFVDISYTVYLKFLRILSDSKRTRMKKKTERRENWQTQ